MGISIKNDRAEKLARQVAAETGESLTEAIIHSLEERLERLKGRRSAPGLAGNVPGTRSLRRHAIPRPTVHLSNRTLRYLTSLSRITPAISSLRPLIRFVLLHRSW